MPASAGQQDIASVRPDAIRCKRLCAGARVRTKTLELAIERREKLFDEQQRRALQIAAQRLHELGGVLPVDHPMVER